MADNKTNTPIEDDVDVITLEFEDGAEIECEVMGIFEYDGNEDGQVDFRILMTGDAESEQLANVIRSGVVGDVDVLKVGHHGSAGALNDDLVHTLKPEIALIGVGEGNKYGHPSGETLETLSRAGCRVYRSDRDGLVSCLFDSGSIHVGLQ